MRFGGIVNKSAILVGTGPGIGIRRTSITIYLHLTILRYAAFKLVANGIILNHALLASAKKKRTCDTDNQKQKTNNVFIPHGQTRHQIQHFRLLPATSTKLPSYLKRISPKTKLDGPWIKIDTRLAQKRNSLFSLRLRRAMMAAAWGLVGSLEPRLELKMGRIVFDAVST